MYYIFNKITIIIVILFILYSLFKNKKNISNYNFYEKNYRIISFFIFIIAIIATTYKFGEIPYGLHVDEAGMAYDALSIHNYGVDRYLYTNPVYFLNYGSGQNALYGYLVIFLLNFFEFSTFVIRLPQIFFKITSFICIYKLFKNSNKVIGLIVLLLFSLCPFFILYSRWALESYLMISTILIAFTFTYFAIEKRKLIYYFLSGLVFGISLYSYAISYIMIPIFLIFLLMYCLKTNKINIKEAIVFIITISVIGLPLLLFLLVNNGYIDGIKSFISIPMLNGYRGSEISISNIINNIHMFISLLTVDNPEIHGTSTYYNGFIPFYTLYAISIPFFVVGIINSVYIFIKDKYNENKLNTLLIMWYISSLISILLVVEPNINKSNAIFIPMIYFVAMGIYYVCKNIKYLSLFIILLYVMNFVSFYKYYMTSYTNDYSNNSFFSYSYQDALKFATTIDRNVIYSDQLVTEPYIYPNLFYNNSPYSFSKQYITINDKQHIEYYNKEDIKLDAIYIRDIEWFNNIQNDNINAKINSKIFNHIVVVWFN